MSKGFMSELAEHATLEVIKYDGEKAVKFTPSTADFNKGVERVSDRITAIQRKLDNGEPLDQCDEFLHDLFAECFDDHFVF